MITGWKIFFPLNFVVRYRSIFTSNLRPSEIHNVIQNFVDRGIPENSPSYSYSMCGIIPQVYEDQYMPGSDRLVFPRMSGIHFSGTIANAGQHTFTSVLYEFQPALDSIYLCRVQSLGEVRIWPASRKDCHLYTAQGIRITSELFHIGGNDYFEFWKKQNTVEFLSDVDLQSLYRRHVQNLLTSLRNGITTAYYDKYIRTYIMSKGEEI